MKKQILALLLCLLLCLETFIPAYANDTNALSETTESGQWVENQTGYWYLRADGTYPYSCWEQIDDSWYYFSPYGYRMTGWLQSYGYWYYLDNNGVMQTGWLTIGNTTYYLNSSGIMTTGWLHLDNGWYYFGSSGAMVKNGWQKIGYSWYYFDNSGIMQTDWLTIGSSTYHLSSSGAMTTGWLYFDNNWYYFGSSGAMIKNGWQKIGYSWYYFDNSGIMQTGWLNYGNAWYYLGADGSMQTNQWIGDYYVMSNGVMATNTWIGSYYVDSSGRWVQDQYYTIDLGNGRYTTVLGHFDSGYSAEIINLVNQYRLSYGLNELTSDPTLNKACLIRASELAYNFSHTRPNGTDCFTVLTDDYWSCGENIASGYPDPYSVMTAWKNSPGHNANMLGSFNCIGVGSFAVKVPGYNYYSYQYVQLFGYK